MILSGIICNQNGQNLIYFNKDIIATKIQFNKVNESTVFLDCYKRIFIVTEFYWYRYHYCYPQGLSTIFVPLFLSISVSLSVCLVFVFYAVISPKHFGHVTISLLQV